MTLEQPIAQGETILVVEDDKNVRRVVAGFLSGLGYTVLEAGDGKTALALLEGAPEIELLLSDVVLPGGLSGPDIVGRLDVNAPISSPCSCPVVSRRERPIRFGCTKISACCASPLQSTTWRRGCGPFSTSKRSDSVHRAPTRLRRWRMGWYSNPRGAHHAYRFSSAVVAVLARPM